MRFLLIFALFTASVSSAQHSSQPEKESVSDLRMGTEVFKVSNLDEEAVIWMERTPNLDYFLKMKSEGQEEKIQKITTKDARHLEKDFASRFLKCQYELPPSPEGCKVTLRLSMKGEGQDVCGKDEKKTQEILPFLKDLHKRF